MNSPYRFKIGDVVKVVGGPTWDYCVDSVQKAYKACIGLRGVVKRRCCWSGGTIYFEPFPGQYIHPYVQKTRGKWISFNHSVLARDIIGEIKERKNEIDKKTKKASRNTAEHGRGCGGSN